MTRSGHAVAPDDESSGAQQRWESEGGTASRVLVATSVEAVQRHIGECAVFGGRGHIGAEGLLAGSVGEPGFATAAARSSRSCPTECVCGRIPAQRGRGKPRHPGIAATQTPRRLDRTEPWWMRRTSVGWWTSSLMPLPTAGRSRFGVGEGCGQAGQQEIQEAVEFGGAVVGGQGGCQCTQ